MPRGFAEGAPRRRHSGASDMMTPTLPDLTIETANQSGDRPVLLLMAYECMPNRGSEAYVGWGRILQAAREFEVHVIVSSESYAAVERYLQSHTVQGKIYFYTPKEDSTYRLLKHIPRLFQYNYVAYQHWQRLALRLARELHSKHNFALVHQVNVCTFREPGYTWTLGIPYVWGPVGGTQNFPGEFLTDLAPVERAKETVRNLTNWISLHCKPRVRHAAKHASVLLAANSTNLSDYERVFNRPVELLLETGLYGVHPPDPVKFRVPGPINLLWSGEFTTRKALPLLLEALSTIHNDVDYQLRILGKGPQEANWKAQARNLGVASRCTFLGHLPLDAAIRQLEWAHLFVFTSLRDTSGNVVLEALSHGVPVVCFDHQGVGDIVTPICGRKIPVTNPAEAIEALAASIRSLAEDRGKLLQLSTGACLRAGQYQWNENGDRVNSIYRSIVRASQAKLATISSR
jgi:glycosyltransferase involved in cell wall biosynthesis